MLYFWYCRAMLIACTELERDKLFQDEKYNKCFKLFLINVTSDKRTFSVVGWKLLFQCSLFYNEGQ